MPFSQLWAAVESSIIPATLLLSVSGAVLVSW
jgi:hypothetical protein